MVYTYFRLWCLRCKIKYIPIDTWMYFNTLARGFLPLLFRSNTYTCIHIYGNNRSSLNTGSKYQIPSRRIMNMWILKCNLSYAYNIKSNTKQNRHSLQRENIGYTWKPKMRSNLNIQHLFLKASYDIKIVSKTSVAFANT